jgi:multidrug efflux pump subunit AcrB
MAQAFVLPCSVFHAFAGAAYVAASRTPADGGTYDELAEWRDILFAKINENNSGLKGLDWDYKEAKPQLRIIIDYDRAADLGVNVGTIGRTRGDHAGFTARDHLHRRR